MLSISFGPWQAIYLCFRRFVDVALEWPSSLLVQPTQRGARGDVTVAIAAAEGVRDVQSAA